MKKPTKDFSKWFDSYGLMDDWSGNPPMLLAAVKRIAWRAYKKGLKDGKPPVYISEPDDFDIPEY